MRVLLFVQTGDGRPKRFKDFTPWQRDDPKWLGVAKDYADGVACDRWWLVECENAEAGRTLIALTELAQAARRYAGAKRTDPVMFSGQVPAGRVLASGGDFELEHP